MTSLEANYYLTILHFDASAAVESNAIFLGVKTSHYGLSTNLLSHLNRFLFYPHIQFFHKSFTKSVHLFSKGPFPAVATGQSVHQFLMYTFCSGQLSAHKRAGFFHCLLSTKLRPCLVYKTRTGLIQSAPAVCHSYK